jgi:DnaJ-class molecular chaperone
MSVAKKQFCTEYEAACLTGMSPDLLRWLTTHAPKSGTSRKLKVAQVEGDTYFFEQGELLEFNNWLKAPWPQKDGKRPNVPTAIRREIINEANGECAICHGHKDTCEAAHLDPVHKSHNNHPENLLWLCANHHTAYDDGLFGPDEENAEFVVNFKRVLHRYKLMLWRTQHEISQKLLTVLEDCAGLAKQLEQAKTKTQIKAVEKIAKETLSKLPSLAPVSKADPKYAAVKSISANIKSLSKDKSAVGERLARARTLRQEYVAAFGFVVCPLCKGSGRREGSDCPVCNGDREIEEDLADRVDLRDYEQVDCPLCEGRGRHNGEDCPECGGEQTMERRYADRVELRDYEEVNCPLCKGSGRHEGEDCPECRGERTMERRYADRVELRDYEEVNCPLCKGSGIRDGDDCPECHGEGRMERRYADRVELRDYKKVDCPLCEGSGIHDGDGCPECRGEGKMERRYADRVEVRDYEKVDCPLCKGRGRYDGEDCPECGGEGSMDRRHADQVDVRQYAKVDCPACRGRRSRNGDDCRACQGEGRMERRFAENLDPRDFD